MSTAESDTSDTIYTWTESTTCSTSEQDDEDEKDVNSFAQIFGAIAMCYFCICGGNSLGFTSSAIPSMKDNGLAPNETVEFPLSPSNSSSVLNDQFMSSVSVSDEELLEKLLLVDTFSPTNNSFDADEQRWSSRRNTDSNSRLYFGPNNDEEFRKLTNTQASWISGLTPLGAFFGSFMAAIPLAFIGPRGTSLYLCAPIFLLGWLITSLAPSIQVVYTGRFVVGFAMGISTSVSPVYIMETASLKLRGPLGTLSQFFITVGILTSFVLGAFLDWREMGLACSCLVVPGIFLLVMIPESPIWLLRKGKLDAARKAHRRLHGDSKKSEIEFSQLKISNYDVIKETLIPYENESPILIATVNMMDLNQNEDEKLRKITMKNEKEDQDENTRRKGTISKYIGEEEEKTMMMRIREFCCFMRIEFAKPGVLKSTLVVFALMIIQQVIGINAVNFYTVTIFEVALGRGGFLSGHLSSVIVSIMLCTATFLSVFLIEKLGRKILLIFSCVFVGLGSFSIGLFFYLKDTGENVDGLSWLPLVSLVVFAISFSLGQGPVLWIIGAEILEPSLRAIMNPAAVALNWFCVFAVAKTYPDLVGLLETFGTFWLYSGLALCGTVFTIIFVPETRGKNAEQIRQFFIR